ncbi:MAG: exodeoxyribonuclease V subunit alpha [Gammaproteobacteria bacterium]|nr:exodeoxyribonuclease V subunit alpha [Gammaproteobacteria bacterium]
MNSQTSWHSALAAGVAEGWLRPLDRAFAGFLHALAPDSPVEVLLAGLLASQNLGRGHICLELDQALEQPLAALGLREADTLLHGLLAGLDLPDWLAVLDASPLVDALGTGSAPLVRQGARLYLRRYWRYEREVAAAIDRRLALPPRELPADFGPRLERLFPAGLAPSDPPAPDWQKLACALAARGAFTLITGGPGTGKTTTVVRLLALLQDLAREREGRSLRIRLAAPTGKAAARLTESIAGAVARLPAGMDLGGAALAASTLHRLLGSRPDSRRFVHHGGNPLHLDVLIVDEASMVDLELMAALLAALPENARLVLLGDKDQLASVEAGSVLGDLCEGAEAGGYGAGTLAWLEELAGTRLAEFAGAGGSLAAQRVMLRHSRRFGAGSGIGRLAGAVNRGEVGAVLDLLDAPPADLSVLRLAGAEDGRLEALALEGYGAYLRELERLRPAPGSPWTDYEAWAAAVLAAFDGFRLLCALRAGPQGVESLNRRIAAALRGAGLLGAGETWYEGRPVMLSRNDYGLGLMNGDIGIALSVPKRRDEGGKGGEALALRVFFPAEAGVKAVLPSRLAEAETVYAMTVHKSQGSEFGHCALVLPERMSPVLTRELIYTGITRAKTRFSLVLAEPSVLPAAVAARTRRASGLREQLGGAV